MQVRSQQNVGTFLDDRCSHHVHARQLRLVSKILYKMHMRVCPGPYLETRLIAERLLVDFYTRIRVNTVKIRVFIVS